VAPLENQAVTIKVAAFFVSQRLHFTLFPTGFTWSMLADMLAKLSC
jgi:hypothetical protein